MRAEIKRVITAKLQLMNVSDNQSINQSTNQSFTILNKESLIPSITQSTNKAISWLINQSFNQIN